VFRGLQQQNISRTESRQPSKENLPEGVRPERSGKVALAKAASFRDSRRQRSTGSLLATPV